jgi:hypothetical protein
MKLVYLFIESLKYLLNNIQGLKYNYGSLCSLLGSPMWELLVHCRGHQCGDGYDCGRRKESGCLYDCGRFPHPPPRRWLLEIRASGEMDVATGVCSCCGGVKGGDMAGVLAAGGLKFLPRSVTLRV